MNPDTPITDSNVRRIDEFSEPLVPRYISEELERELAVVTKQRDEAREQHQILYEQTGNTIYEARKQRDRLAENLQRALNATVLNHRKNRWYIDAEYTLQLLQPITPNAEL